MASSSATTSRSRSPQTQSTRASTEHHHHHHHHLPIEKQHQQHHQHYQPNHVMPTIPPCEKCEGKAGDRGTTRFDVPLIALPRLLNALLGFATVVRVHTSLDAGWWPWEHKVLFALCWAQFLWNLAHGWGAVLGYAWWPSPRRVVGLPPLTLVISGCTVLSWGGPDEDDGARRRRWRRVQFTAVDLAMAVPTLGFLIYSAHIMYPWWGSRYVGLWSPTIGLIATLVSFEFLTAILQLFQIFEAKVIGIQLTMQDIYECDHSAGRLQL
ncbi:hypothetical protein F5Y15DRAFT_342714 [Xylariaceae sp. FL0016]|nr:hypothetical protein F5Y15DRAFT_342714 [Xylariaceae sp. FL0016]